VSADVRGSGASFGTRAHPWSPEEIRDAGEIVDWIVTRPWSNGRVVAEGISYEGASAEFLLLNRRPAVAAVAPRFSLFDAYADVAFPGGVPQQWFLEAWSTAAQSLDRNRLPAFAGFLPRLLVRGVRPVGDDRALLRSALRDHTGNVPMASVARGTFRDDRSPESGAGVKDMSPDARRAELLDAGVPAYSWSGWYDGACVMGAVRRHLSVPTPGSRLILGPWVHGGDFSASPTSPGPSAFDAEAELLRFFDRSLRGLEVGAPVVYYTQVEDRWKAAEAWPPPATARSWYLGGDRSLVADPPREAEAGDRYQVDYSAGTGRRSRWESVLIPAPVTYPDRAQADRKLLTYTSEPLAKPLEVTGHPQLLLFVASTATDGAFFGYLEDVGPEGAVTYVTEGMLRALHRKLAPGSSPLAALVPAHSYRRADALPLVPGEVAELRFGLLPTSYVFRAGHRIRLALAGADRDHFALIPPDAPPAWDVHRDAPHPSRVILPVP
jgi:putative CocE/NonD family hydrolase